MWSSARKTHNIELQHYYPNMSGTARFLVPDVHFVVSLNCAQQKTAASFRQKTLSNQNI